jgi:hypothetical protein
VQQSDDRLNSYLICLLMDCNPWSFMIKDGSRTEEVNHPLFEVDVLHK